MAKINTLNYQTVAAWNGSQDLFVVEQQDGTKVATPAQIKQYVLGSSIDDIYSVMGQMGAKNLLVPEWVETKTTENGVTYTFNADGTIIMNTDENGATANTNCNLRQNTVTTNNVFPAGTYTLTACPAGGSSTTYRTWARAYRPGTNTALTDNLYEEGNGVSFTVSEPFSLGLNVTVRSGYVCNNLTWKPMLRYASDTDNTYQPFAMTNKQLTDELDTAREQIAQLNDDLVATRTNITPQTGVNTDNNNKCYYEKVAGVVNVVINVKQLTAGTVSRICTLPAGYRPYAKITSAADNAGTGTGRAFVNVDASGNVDAYTSATQYVSGQLTFVAYS